MISDHGKVPLHLMKVLKLIKNPKFLNLMKTSNLQNIEKVS
jgi:hypothetical protein